MGLILVANPGSSSRKYAVFTTDLVERGQLHIESKDGALTCSAHDKNESRNVPLTFHDLADAAGHLHELLSAAGLLSDGESIDRIGLRIVAPSGFFMHDHLVDDDVVRRLEEAHSLAPLHIDASLHELKQLRAAFADTDIIGVSDSAFHATKPNYVWNYGINIHDADRLDVKRFGYHGLSAESAVNALWNAGKLPPKVIICHLGSGSSITGVFHGRSIDTTMGYTPLDGVIMATRSGAIDPGAVRALQRGLSLDDAGLEHYLNTQSGLLGLGGSNDIRELITREAAGDHMAHLALTTLVHSYHKAIGSMLVAMNGCDMLVFTGTVGERSAILRKRIVAHLEFHDFILDGDTNDATTSPEGLTVISQRAKSRPIVVIPADEALAIAKHAKKF